MLLSVVNVERGCSLWEKCTIMCWTLMIRINAWSVQQSSSSPAARMFISHKTTKHKGKILAAAQWCPDGAKVKQDSGPRGGCGWTSSGKFITHQQICLFPLFFQRSHRKRLLINLLKASIAHRQSCISAASLQDHLNRKACRDQRAGCKWNDDLSNICLYLIFAFCFSINSNWAELLVCVRLNSLRAAAASVTGAPGRRKVTGSEASTDMKPAFVSGVSPVTEEIPELPPIPHHHHPPTPHWTHWNHWNNSPIVKSSISTKVDLAFNPGSVLFLEIVPNRSFPIE